MKKFTNIVILAAIGLLFTNLPAMAGKGCKGCPHAKGAKQEKMCPTDMEGMETVKKNTDAGMEITMTAKDKEGAAKIQQTAAAHYAPKGKPCACTPKGAKVAIENTETGVKIIITGDNPKLIKAIQAGSAKECGCKGHKKAAGIKEGKKAAKYACPMGCAESDKPGKCPKCGMDMVEKK